MAADYSVDIYILESHGIVAYQGLIHKNFELMADLQQEFKNQT
jgi:hypothetical protein